MVEEIGVVRSAGLSKLSIHGRHLMKAHHYREFRSRSFDACKQVPCAY